MHIPTDLDVWMNVLVFAPNDLDSREDTHGRIKEEKQRGKIESDRKQDESKKKAGDEGLKCQREAYICKACQPP